MAPPGSQVAWRTVIPATRGLSGLAPEGETLWAVPERVRELLRLDRRGKVLERVKLEGVPEGLDVESMAVLADGRFALGTESGVYGRATDLVLFAERRDGKAVVSGRLELAYGPFGYQPRSNEGIEGLCRTGNLLIVAVERDPGRLPERRTPLAIFDLELRRWRVASVPLTSAQGTLSALACPTAPADGLVRVLAVERQLGVGRVLELELPVSGGRGTSRVVADFTPLVNQLINVEGIASDGDGFLLINDNENLGMVVGDSMLLRLTPEPSAARASRP